MKQIFVILFSMFLFAGVSGNAQTNTDTILEKGRIYDTVDVRPQFPGGEDACLKFLENNLKYPGNEIHIEGKVVVSFVVETNGKLTNVQIQRTAHPLLNAEVLRVVTLMPNYEPGMLNGEKVRVRFILPVDFVLK